MGRTWLREVARKRRRQRPQGDRWVASRPACNETWCIPTLSFLLVGISICQIERSEVYSFHRFTTAGSLPGQPGEGQARCQEADPRPGSLGTNPAHQPSKLLLLSTAIINRICDVRNEISKERLNIVFCQAPVRGKVLKTQFRSLWAAFAGWQQRPTKSDGKLKLKSATLNWALVECLWPSLVGSGIWLLAIAYLVTYRCPFWRRRHRLYTRVSKIQKLANQSHLRALPSHGLLARFWGRSEILSWNIYISIFF